MSQHEKKLTCASKGHLWEATASGLIFRCTRTGCKTMQHCINDVWHVTEPRALKPQAAPAAQPAELWT